MSLRPGPWWYWLVAVAVTVLCAAVVFGLFALLPHPAMHALETEVVTPA